MPVLNTVVGEKSHRSRALPDHFHSRISLLLLLSSALLVAGCNRFRPTEQVEIARKHLQLNRPSQAIEALAKEHSAEGHYLKSVALQAVGERTAAREQIDQALSIEPEEAKYKGYQALLDLAGNKSGAAQRLIELFDLYPSSPAIAFFATRAFAAKQNIKGSLRSFKLGLTLIDEVPEFMFHALQHAIATQQTAEAKQLFKKLEAAAPENADFLRDLLKLAVRGKQLETAEHLYERIQKLTPDAPDLETMRVQMELLLGRPEAALAAARKALETTPNDPQLELLLAEAILRGDAKPERERELAAIAARHPDRPDFLARQANYLVKNKRLPEAIQVVNRALNQAKSPPLQAVLLSMAIRIPLDANAADLAEKQLNLYGAKFSNPLLVNYFRGRILVMKGDPVGAIDEFQKVVTSPASSSSDAGRALATECLNLQRQILASQAVNARLKAAQEEIKKLRESPNSIPSLAQPTITPAGEAPKKPEPASSPSPDPDPAPAKPVEKPVEKSAEIKDKT